MGPGWLQCPALGRPGNFGHLYNARDDSVLPATILKSSSLPEDCLESLPLPETKYKAKVAESLEEKFSNLQLSADFRANVLCGVFRWGWGGEYLSSRKKNARTQQVSVICTIRTKYQSLLLESDKLRDYISLNTLDMPDATHIIRGIEWGAQLMVTARKETMDVNQSHEFRTNLGNSAPDGQGVPGGDNRSTRDSIVNRVVNAIAHAHGDGKVDSASNLKEMASTLEFETMLEGFDPDVVFKPTNFDQVLDFLQNSRLSGKLVNNDQGVPIAFHLMPIGSLAKSFKVELKHDTFVRELDEGCINGFVRIFEEQAGKTQLLRDYETRLKDHRFCVPEGHLEDAYMQKCEAEDKDELLRFKLKEAIQGIRDGSKDMNALHELYKRYNTPSAYPSIINKYVDKMEFADVVRSSGAEYIKNCTDKLGRAIDSTHDRYVFYFNEASRRHPDWQRNRQKVMELLREQDHQDHHYRVIVVDCDVGEPKALEKAYIEQFRNSKRIVSDVVEELKALDRLCRIKCSDQSQVERTDQTPAGSRFIRAPCPGKHCFGTRSVSWVCESCKCRVSYGVTDEYLYCSCSRYPATLATFKCSNNVHGAKYAKHDEAFLLGLLKKLDTFETYNILILGHTGVGKSMFINAFLNYLEFNSLTDALAEAGPPRHEIPFSFRFDGREVNVGQETDIEKPSTKGESATKHSVVYSFSFEDIVIRIIDTPGIGDPEGIDQDRKNMKNILWTVESIDKLHAILILLKPDESRLDTSFEFCITELFYHLHKDVSRNIIFGFTSADPTNYKLGQTERPLKTILQELDTKIVLGNENQFFFDSGGFMFLADHKQNGPQSIDQLDYENMWMHSAIESRRLIRRVMQLDPHEAMKTLRLNKVRMLIEKMQHDFAQFVTAMEQSEKKLADFDLQGAKNAVVATKPKVSITVPIKKKLSKPRTVCGHPSCSDEKMDKDGSKYVIRKVCHDNCNLKVAEELPGCEGIKSCWIFHGGFLWLWDGYACGNCRHAWTEHLHVSYEYILEERFVDEKENLRQEVRKERAQITLVRAQFAIYISKNALAITNDATARYLDYQIANANRRGNSNTALDLNRQKEAHEVLVKKLEDDIRAGASKVPNEEDVENMIQELKKMKTYGKYFTDAIDDKDSSKPAVRRWRGVVLRRLRGWTAWGI